jgi:formylglycine-generating enzyme required for sulfatase activity
MKSICLLPVLVAAIGAFADAMPTVSNVTISTPSRHVLSCSYEVDKPAVITVDFLTNGVSIGSAAVMNTLHGDVNRLVSAGTHTFTWDPMEAWTGCRSDNFRAVVKAWPTNSPPDYMVVRIGRGNSEKEEFGGWVRYYEKVEDLPFGGLENDCYRTNYVAFRKIPARGVTFLMGGMANENAAFKGNAATRTHEVTLDYDYYMAVFEATQGHYKTVVGSYWHYSEIYPQGESNVPEGLALRPVEGTWYQMRINTGNSLGDADKYLPNCAYGNAIGSDGFLGKISTFTGIPFEFPTEAEWEFAARGGNGPGFLPDGTRMYTTVNGEKNIIYTNYLSRCVRNKANSYISGATEPTLSGRTEPLPLTQATARVGSYEPNGFGLYDMIGNQAEMCFDVYVADIANANGARQECELVAGTVNTSRRVHRGGSWRLDSSNVALYPGYRNGNDSGSRTPKWGAYAVRLTVRANGYGTK